MDAVDGGISVDPDDLVQQAIETNADVIALSTYNGIAESYIDRLVNEIAKSGQSFEVFVGGDTVIERIAWDLMDEADSVETFSVIFGSVSLFLDGLGSVFSEEITGLKVFDM